MTEFINIALLFTIYSFAGWLLETVYASIREKRFVNRGFLAGCFCPIYGISSVLIIKISTLVNLAVSNYFVATIVKVLIYILLITSLEYITGFILERIFNCKWWDYSSNAFNLYGYVCLKYSILWGGLAFLLAEVIHPAIMELVYYIPFWFKEYGIIVICIYFIADTAKTVIDTLGLRKVILNHLNLSTNKYHEKLVQYKRFFLAFPKLLNINAGIMNRDIRSILNERIDKIKVEIKNRYM